MYTKKECVSHLAGLSGSLDSAHLKVTLLGAAGVTGGPLAPWAPKAPGNTTLTTWLSSSAKTSRKEREEGGDWTAVALKEDRVGEQSLGDDATEEVDRKEIRMTHRHELLFSLTSIESRNVD